MNNFCLQKEWTLNSLKMIRKNVICIAAMVMILRLVIPESISGQQRPANTQRQSGEPEMIFVEGGTFTMGCTSEQGSDCDNSEKPAHQVTLDGFYIGKYEVTQAQWKAIMGTTIKQQRDKDDTSGNLFGEGDRYPIYYVSWNETQEFIARLNKATGKKYRLPTEAEWEYAARGGKKSKNYKYSGSNVLGDVAWYGWHGDSDKIHPVGTKSSNELGIYDMSGNVAEWCNDWHSEYSSNSQTNPTGLTTGSGHVVRGGDWVGGDRYSRVSYRGNRGGIPGFRSGHIGFRLVYNSK
jgi:formylglycine-generating enzyme required for sulfatase activity